MNYLAHLYLSGHDPEIMTGNFIGDHVKGKNYAGFSDGIIKGIELHRAIDSFTDSHVVVAASKARLRPHFHKYAPVITDVFYDHFLAVNWKEYASMNLLIYSREVYAIIRERHHLLPERAKHMFTYMEPQNWLVHYASLEGIHRALSGMARRTRFESGMETASVHLDRDYEFYEKEFDVFFPDLVQFSNEFLKRS